MATKTAAALPAELLELYEDEQYMGPARPLPHAQLLNDKASWGLFLKDATVSRIGWFGDWQEHPNRHEHVFSSGDSETGLLFREVSFKVLSASDRFIEERGTKSVIGNFDTPEGKQLYEERSDLQLRRLFLLYICDSNGKRLHASPVTLSVMGVASARFGSAYDQFTQELDQAYAAASGRELVAARARKVYGLATFSVQFGMEMYGPDRGQKSPICIVQDFVHPTPANLASLFATGEEKNFLWAAHDTFVGSFAEKFLRSCEAALGHQIAPNVFAALPADPQTGEIVLPEGSAIPGAIPALPF